MSKYLALLPLKSPEHLTKTSVLCRERLEYDQDYRIFGQLGDFSHYRNEADGSDIPERPTIKTLPLPPQLWIETYEHGGVVRRREDDWDGELTFVYAGELRKLDLPDDCSPKAKAIKAFIDALPKDTPIVLLWS